jgi:methionine aminopeptidase
MVGHILADAMDWVPTFVKPGVSTLAIDTEVEALFSRRGATPVFKAYLRPST